MTAHLEGAYYVPSELAFVWDTWVGAGAGLLRVNRSTFYFTADLETILGRDRRPFDANQVNAHLEGGVQLPAGRQLVTPFFHHVSRHLVDRPKTQLVDWNMLGLQVAGALPQAFRLRGSYAASVGHTVEWRTTGYEWELTAVLDLEVWRSGGTAAYLLAAARLVTVDAQARVPRGDFVDFRGEGGARLGREGRSLHLFAAYEHRNDVLLLAPSARDRALFGLRIGFAPPRALGPHAPLGWPGVR